MLLGDKDQLSSVEAGAVLGDLCEGAQFGRFEAGTADYVWQACGERLPAEMVTGGTPLAQSTIMLRRSRRFGGAIGRLALAVNADEVGRAEDILRAADGDEVAWLEHARLGDIPDLSGRGRLGADGGYATYLNLAKAGPGAAGADLHTAWVKSVLGAFDAFRVLCAVRQGEWGVEGVNAAIEARLVQEGLVVRSGEWYACRRVMVTQNDYNIGVFNGDVGITLPDVSDGGHLRVYFQSGERISSVLPTRLPHIETAYVMTVHKVQGLEFAHTVLVLPARQSAVVVRELICTGITRARQQFTLLTPNARQFADGIRQQTRRASGLRDFIDRECI